MTTLENTNQLKLLSVRRQGEGVPDGKTEFQISLSATDGVTPWSGSLTVLLADKDAERILSRSFGDTASQVLYLLLEANRFAWQMHSGWQTE